MRNQRKNRSRAVGLGWLLCLCLGSLAASGQQFSAPVEARVPMVPTAIRGSDGRLHLEYELHLTNFYASNGPLRLSELSVVPQGSSVPFATFTGKQLADIAKPRPQEADGKVILPAGGRTVFFPWITVPDGAALPSGLSHRMTFQDAKGVTRTLQGVAVTLSQRPAITIAPPLRGGRAG